VSKLEMEARFLAGFLFQATVSKGFYLLAKK
jgi:hypothetical protein